MDTKEADKKKFVKGATLGGFICFLLMGMAAAFPAYYIVTEWGSWPEGMDTVCFLLYIGIFIGEGIWLLCCLVCRNGDGEAILMMIQPFVLVVTLWGYYADEFENYKGWITAIAAAVLVLAFLVNLMVYNDKQKKRTADVTIEKNAAVYKVVLINGKGTENHYRITVRK